MLMGIANDSKPKSETSKEPPVALIEGKKQDIKSEKLTPQVVKKIEQVNSRLRKISLTILKAQFKCQSIFFTLINDYQVFFISFFSFFFCLF
jgi:hypothetical protein